jgi:hypothetical protein
MIPAAQVSPPRNAASGWPWYPFVGAAYPLWFIYFSNPGQVSLVSAAWTTAFVLAVVAGLLWIAIRLTRSRHVGAMAVAVIILAFFAYGPTHDMLVRASANPEVPDLLSWLSTVLSPHAVLTPVMLALSAAALFMVIRRVNPDATRLSGACNFAVTALAAIMLVQFATEYWRERGLRIDPAKSVADGGRAISVLGYNPDVYYIILDGYARADMLREYYGFDNSEFVAGLGERGFAVNDDSRANYFWTVLSLGSSLNYSYLQDIAAPILADAKASNGRQGYAKVQRLVQDNRAAQFLRERGYRFVHLRSSTPHNPYADEEVPCKGGLFDDEYFRAIAEVSWLQAIGVVATADLADCHRQRLQSLGDQARHAGPKFVFAHFLPPHHPYLFDHEGNVLKHVTVSNQFDFQSRLWEDRNAYLEQLRYMNRSILEVIDRILAESAKPPVIIIQSDHGPHLRKGMSEGQTLSVRLANFAAYHLPGARDVMPRDCAPVNQFRYLFNHYFDAGLPILPNKSYVSDYVTILQMREIDLKSLPGKSS